MYRSMSEASTRAPSESSIESSGFLTDARAGRTQLPAGTKVVLRLDRNGPEHRSGAPDPVYIVHGSCIHSDPVNSPDPAPHYEMEDVQTGGMEKIHMDDVHWGGDYLRPDGTREAIDTWPGMPQEEEDVLFRIMMQWFPSCQRDGAVTVRDELRTIGWLPQRQMRDLMDGLRQMSPVRVRQMRDIMVGT